MKPITHINLLGRIFGNDTLGDYLRTICVKEVPILESGEPTTHLSSRDLGIEFVFRGAEFFEQLPDNCPEGALVLSNVAFYGFDGAGYTPYTGELPCGLKFGTTRDDVFGLIGTPNWMNGLKRKARWDFESYCLFCDFDESGRIDRVSIQLPVR